MRRWASHPDTIIAPVDLQGAAVQINPDLAPRQATTRSCNSSGTRRRPGRQRHTNPAFPHPHPDVIRADEAGELHIRAFRIKRVMFDFSAARSEINRLRVVHKKRTMRVAHARGTWRTVNGQAERVDLLRQRHLVPFQLRLAHVDGGQPVARIYRRQIAAVSVDIDLLKGHVETLVGSLIDGNEIGPRGSLPKLFWSEAHQNFAALALEIVSQFPVTMSDDLKAVKQRMEDIYLKARAETIYAGTTEIQLGIIAKRILRLNRGA